jgi:hypothetical protein
MTPGRILNRLLGPGLDFGSVQFFVRELTGTLAPSRACSLTVRRASADEVPRLLESSHPARQPATLTERFQRGISASWPKMPPVG